jgi:hypothetical protein
MVKYKQLIFLPLIIIFLIFSFYPTIFALKEKPKLVDSRREFILEHNYYWPDYNLYLSKIRQGALGNLLPIEKYTSEPHQGSLIQSFYAGLGFFGKKVFSLTPNDSYLLGRIVLSPILLVLIAIFSTTFFKKWQWQLTAFLIVITSGSMPRFYQDSQGVTHIGRFMEWWSNIDALQRITFIPHILFGQIASFFILYHLAVNNKQKTVNKFIFLIILGNLTGLVFPPSLITLNTVLVFLIFIPIVKQIILRSGDASEGFPIAGFPNPLGITIGKRERQDPQIKITKKQIFQFLFVICSFPSLLYLFTLTRQMPWSSLVEFHRTHPMMIPFGEYIKGTGYIFYLGFAGIILAVFNRAKKYYPLIFWILTTFIFAILFTHIKEQSPLRFTQTGLFIPLGILGTYFFQQIWNFISIKRQASSVKSIIKICYMLTIICYLIFNFYMLHISLTWQTTWYTQLIRASIPDVPYPPQAMPPLRDWMEGIRYLRDYTSQNDVVLAAITAGNYIPAYSGNTVYFGQSNTVNYENKQIEVNRFFKGEMTTRQAELFLSNGRVKYVFESVQEREFSKGKKLNELYPFLKPIYSNSITTIYKI